MADAVNKNYNEFNLRNLAVAQEQMDKNLELDRERKERERLAKEADMAQD